MQCLILAGGLGTRMQSVAPDLPKTLLPVNGRPFADYQLSWLRDQGVDRVVYAIGHQGEAIRDFAGDGGTWGLEIAYADEGEARLGTGGAVRKAVADGLMDDGFFVLYGDSYLRIDLAAVWRASDDGRQPLTTVFRNDGRWDASNMAVLDGKVVRYVKGLADPAAAGLDHIDYGLSVLNVPAVIDALARVEPADLSQVFEHLIGAGRLRAFAATERFYEIGSPDGLADFEAFVRDTALTP